MKISVTKTADRPEIVALRDDGVSVMLRTPDRKFSLPHDLMHLIVENGLSLKCGFWGSIADGAKFSSLQIVGGRQRPKANERSEELLKANQKSLSDAEMIVGAFQTVLHEGLEPPIDQLAHMLRGGGFNIDDGALRQTWGELLTFRDQWEALEKDATLNLEWISHRRSKPRSRN